VQIHTDIADNVSIAVLPPDRGFIPGPGIKSMGKISRRSDSIIEHRYQGLQRIQSGLERITLHSLNVKPLIVATHCHMCTLNQRFAHCRTVVQSPISTTECVRLFLYRVCITKAITIAVVVMVIWHKISRYRGLQRAYNRLVWHCNGRVVFVKF